MQPLDLRRVYVTPLWRGATVGRPVATTVADLRAQADERVFVDLAPVDFERKRLVPGFVGIDAFSFADANRRIVARSELPSPLLAERFPADYDTVHVAFQSPTIVLGAPRP